MCKIVCKICNKECNNLRSLSIHIRLCHKNITIKEYYDLYLKNEEDGKCLYCNKPTKFVSLIKGYKKWCSGKCKFLSPGFKQEAEATCFKKYGVKNPRQSKLIKDKEGQTSRRRYNADSSAQSSIIQEKYITTRKNNTIKKYNTILNQNNIVCTGKTKFWYFLYCNDCNTNFKISAAQFNRTIKRYNKVFCPKCMKEKHYTGYSYLEKELFNFIKENYHGIILQNTTSILKRKEIDIYLPDLNLGFEFDGTYWHADPRFYKENDIIRGNLLAADIWKHDKEKDERCQQLNVKLIHIKEYDWLNTKEQVKKYILGIIYENCNAG